MSLLKEPRPVFAGGYKYFVPPALPVGRAIIQLQTYISPRSTHVSPKLRPFKVFRFSIFYVPEAIARAFQNALRMGKGGAVIEPKVRALGITRDVKNAIA